MTPGGRRLDVTEVQGVTVVCFRDGRLDDDRGVQELGRELFDLVEQEGHKVLLLDFSSVESLSSTALGKLIVLDRKALLRGIVLKLSNIPPALYEAFAATKLDQLFEIVKDRGQVLAAC
jgi:anti-sigma B factor antagonist